MSKIVFRLGTTIPNSELMDVGEPLWDVDNAKLGVNNGESQPRWYPRIDLENNLILNPNTGIYSSNYTQNRPNSYLTFNGSEFKLYSNNTLVASFQDTGNQLYTALVANSGISSAGQVSFPGFTIDTQGNVTISGNLVIEGSMNLSLSQFAASVLPTAFNPGNILIAGSPHTWQDPVTLIKNTSLALSLARLGGNSESFKMDFINNNYLAVNSGDASAWASRRLTDFFTNPSISYSRASIATYYDKHGVLQKASVNIPREDYDPFTGEKLGLLIEGGSTNLIYNASDPTIWATTNGTLALSNNALVNAIWTSKNLPIPNELTENTTNGNHNANILVLNASETLPVTFSCFIQADPNAVRNTCAITVENAAGSNTFGVYLNLSPMSVGISIATGNGVLLRTNIKQVTDSIYRVSLTGTINAASGAASASVRVRISGVSSSNLSYVGTANGALMLCSNYQLEIYDKASSFIPTSGTIATRNPDSLSINLSTIDFDPSVGTVKLNMRLRSFTSIGTPILNLQSTTDNTSSHNLALNSSSIPELVVQNAGLVLYDIVLGAFAANAPNTIIYNYKNNGKITVNENGAISTATNTGVQSLTINKLNIGQNANATQFLDGWVASLSYLNKIVTQ